MMLNQCTCVIKKNFSRHAAEPQERPLDTFKPVGLPFTKRRADMKAPRITKSCHKQINPNTLAADPDARLTKIDL